LPNVESAKCPLVFCASTHRIKLDKAKVEFMYCDTAKTGIWFRTSGAQHWLENQDGGSARPVPRGANPSEDQEETKPKDSIPCERCGSPITADDLARGFCLGCGERIVVGDANPKRKRQSPLERLMR